MADGSVIIKVDADEKAAVKKLHKVEAEIDKLQEQLSEKNTQKMGLVSELEKASKVLDELKAKENPFEKQAEGIRSQIKALEQQAKFANEDWLAGKPGADVEEAGLRNQIAALENRQADILKQSASFEKNLSKEIKAAQGEVDNLNNKIKTLSISQDGINKKLEKQKRIYGETQIQVSKITSENKALKDATEAVGESADRFYKRIRLLLKNVFVFTVLASAFRSLRETMKVAIMSNDEASASFSRLKAAALTLVQPLVELLLPALTWVANALTKVVTVLAYLFSAMTGKTYEQTKDSAEALEEEKQAINGVGNAAKKATKQLAAFDEINALSEESASAASGYLVPDFDNLGLDDLPEWIKELTLDLEAKIKDISFSFDKKSLKKNKDAWIVALTAILGAVIGSMFGGLWGTVIGITLGALIGLGACTFLDKLKNPDAAKETLIVALGAMIGAIGGSLIGGPVGGVIGFLLGTAITLIGLEFSKGDNKTWDSANTGIAVIGAILGAVGGYLIGGLAGGAIGFSLGLVISLITMRFAEGKWNKYNALAILRVVLFAMIGAIGGALIGGPVGGAIGLSLGLALGLGTVAFDDKMTASARNTAKTALKGVVTNILKALFGTFGSGVFGGISGDTIKATLKLAVSLGKTTFSGGSGLTGSGRSAVTGQSASYYSSPALATGTVVPPNREFLAMLGDNKTETEVVSPLSTMKQAMLEALRESGGNGGGNITLYVYLNGRKMAVEMVKEINDMTREAGKPVLLL